MSKVNNLKIAIDIRRKRIRLTKSVLDTIGNPERILLLVNPVSRSIAIIPGDDSKNSHKVGRVTNKGYELTSKSLIDNLFSLCPDWVTDYNYHIIGAFVESVNAIEFAMDDAVMYRKAEKNCERQ